MKNATLDAARRRLAQTFEARDKAAERQKAALEWLARANEALREAELEVEEAHSAVEHTHQAWLKALDEKLEAESAPARRKVEDIADFYGR